MILRSSLVSTLKSCPAKACYQYELGLTPIRTKQIRNDMDFGKIVHNAIEIYHIKSLDSAITYISETDLHETKRKNKSTAKSLLKQYATTNCVEMQELEKDFQFKIGSHVWKGRFDGIGIYHSSRWVIEHKTTNPYYLFLKPNDQFIAYWLGGLIFYHDIEGVLINNLDCDKIQVNRYPIRFTQEEKEEWIDEMKLTAETYKRFKTKGIFPRNPSACFDYQRLCPYFSLCSESEGNRPNIISRCYKVNQEAKDLNW